MSLILKVVVLVLALFITGFLFYLSSSLIYVLQIGVDPRDETGVIMRRDKVIVINKGKGPIFFDVAGNLANTSVSEVSLRLRSPRDPGFRAPVKFPVSNGVFIGVVQLSSADSPDLSDTDYTYELYSGNNNSHLSDGYIRLQVKAVVSGASPWSMVVIGVIGLLASLLQFFQFIIQRDKAAKPHEVPSTSSQTSTAFDGPRRGLSNPAPPRDNRARGKADDSNRKHQR